ncbi:MAG: sigma-54 dependent transcriptional regulator [Proteobacteria bacterium]|nr:sigma-54 dependent transcriptional regulator [Pseudomonadota bacterium]MBU1737323.1 sigma-54 dependent transcriptional regulator [Pseudomonadota bacterium]
MDRAPKILIVDNDQEMRISLFEAMSRKGYEVSVAENGSMALNMVKRNAPDIMIAEIRMPEMDGMELLRSCRKHYPEVSIILITAHASIETAVEAMKCGAFDYIIKPFPVEVVEDTVERLIISAMSRPALQTARERTRGRTEKPIIGNDKKLMMLMDRARSVASSKATVLVLGESGTGKEVFARYLHNESDRRDGPFVALNCAALPETLLESELFGHEKGAFTGAVTTKKGKFELADRGTLLLDEIGEIPLHLQSKLLRVLQEEEVDRLGGRNPISIDVHVVATTNRSLENAVSEGAFRQDLYYRLNVIPLVLPPLRERPGDILMLADHFIEKYSVLYNKEFKKMSGSSVSRFLEYEWPGNVREMENLVERAVLLSSGSMLDVDDFWINDNAPMAGKKSPFGPSSAVSSVMGVPDKIQTLREVERQMILQALRQTDNNRTHAAKLLGVSVRTLRNKLHEYRTHGTVD